MFMGSKVFIIATAFLSVIIIGIVAIVFWSDGAGKGLLIIIPFIIIYLLFGYIVQYPSRYGRSDKRKDEMQKLAQEMNLTYRDILKEESTRVKGPNEKFLIDHTNYGILEIGVVEGNYQGYQIKVVDSINSGMGSMSIEDVSFKEFYTDVTIDDETVFSRHKMLIKGFLTTKQIKSKIVSYIKKHPQ